jgi:hypothetical protein
MIHISSYFIDIKASEDRTLRGVLGEDCMQRSVMVGTLHHRVLGRTRKG